MAFQLIEASVPAVFVLIAGFGVGEQVVADLHFGRSLAVNEIDDYDRLVCFLIRIARFQVKASRLGGFTSR